MAGQLDSHLNVVLARLAQSSSGSCRNIKQTPRKKTLTVTCCGRNNYNNVTCYCNIRNYNIYIYIYIKNIIYSFLSQEYVTF